jgi:hypothetical protein
MLRLFSISAFFGALFVGAAWGDDDDRATALRNNSCAKYALWVVAGVHDDGDLPVPELMKYCNDAIPSIC